MATFAAVTKDRLQRALVKVIEQRALGGRAPVDQRWSHTCAGTLMSAALMTSTGYKAGLDLPSARPAWNDMRGSDAGCGSRRARRHRHREHGWHPDCRSRPVPPDFAYDPAARGRCRARAAPRRSAATRAAPAVYDTSAAPLTYRRRHRTSREPRDAPWRRSFSFPSPSSVDGFLPSCVNGAGYSTAPNKKYEDLLKGLAGHETRCCRGAVDMLQGADLFW